MGLESDRPIEEACFVFDAAGNAWQIRHLIGDLVPGAVVFIGRRIFVRRCRFEANDQRIQLDHDTMIMQLIKRDLPRHLLWKWRNICVNGSF